LASGFLLIIGSAANGERRRKQPTKRWSELAKKLLVLEGVCKTSVQWVNVKKNLTETLNSCFLA